MIMRIPTVVVGSMCVAALVVASVSAQRLAMMRAEWSDLESWSRYDESTRENELGLGLHVSGPSGATFVAFTGRLLVRSPSVPPTQIGVQVAVGKLSNPNIVRRPALMFVADAGTDELFRLDVSPRLNVDDPTPGGGVENGTAMIRSTDFVRIARAKKLAADVLGFEAVFREDQLKAMLQFAERLHIVPIEKP